MRAYEAGCVSRPTAERQAVPGPRAASFKSICKPGWAISADLPIEQGTKFVMIINLVWGDFCQGGASRILSIFLYLSFFVRPDKTRFFVPTHTSPCRRAQERSRLGSAPSCADPTGGLGLDGSEHGGTLGRSRDDEVEGSPRVVHEASCHILVFGGREAQTMMQ